MDILHAQTDPTLLDRLKEMLRYSKAADIAVGYLFVSGFDAVAEEISQLEKARILVGRTDRPMLEEVARGLQQAEALRARLDGDGTVRRSARDEIGAQAVQSLAEGVSRLPQTDASQCGIQRLRDLIAQGKIEIRTYPKGVLHAKAYLCWHRHPPNPGSAIVGSSNFTLAGFTGNTELNVEVNGTSAMNQIKDWFDALWAESVDVTQDVAVELHRSWAVAQTPPTTSTSRRSMSCTAASSVSRISSRKDATYPSSPTSSSTRSAVGCAWSSSTAAASSATLSASARRISARSSCASSSSPSRPAATRSSSVPQA